MLMVSGEKVLVVCVHFFHVTAACPPASALSPALSNSAAPFMSVYVCVPVGHDGIVAEPEPGGPVVILNGRCGALV